MSQKATTVTQPARNRGPQSGSHQCSAVINDVINYTCDFPALTCHTHTHVCSSKVWHTAQESLVVSDRCSCHCHAQHLRSARSKYTSANLCAQSGLKMRCDQAHYWCIAILRQEKAIGPLTNKNLVESQWRSIPPAI